MRKRTKINPEEGVSGREDYVQQATSTMSTPS
jgi:hypothetical protein